MEVRWRELLWMILFLIQVTKAARNKVLGVRTSCDERGLNVTLKFGDGFRGVVFPRGFLRRCNSSGDGAHTTSIALALPDCGVRVTASKETGKLLLSAVIQVQMSSSLQQVDDPSFPVSCGLEQDMFPIHSRALLSQRKGRGLQEGSGGRAWLEVKGSAISTLSPAQPLSVGEHTTLAIYTSLPEGVGSAPGECRVEDGQGSVQLLSDHRGCPTEPALVPRLRFLATSKTWVAAFPAFSFPDRRLVHYLCRLTLCSGPCPKVDCNSDQNSTRGSRNFQEEEGLILDVVELHNSVEVTAPNIELGFLQRNEAIAENNSDEDKGWVCLPAGRVAVMLAGLGCLFLVASLAALCLLLRRSSPVPSGPPLLPQHRTQSLWSI